jgi:hypothetical protein
MPYTVTASDGAINITIPDGTADTTSTNLTLPGPNWVGYGSQLNENLLALLTNFASNSAPIGNNVLGQLWFDKGHQTLKVFANVSNQAQFTPVSGIIVSTSQPVIGQLGNMWYNPGTNQIWMYNNGTYNLIAPLYTSQQGPSGAIPVTLQDLNVVNATHNIIELVYGSTVIATISSDNTFQPNPAITGFPYINPGITINNTLTGTALNSNLVGNVVGSLTGNVTGNVTATTLTGSLTGNVQSNYGSVNNLSTANLVATSGSATGLINLSATNFSATNSVVATEVVTNFSTANAQIAGGNVKNLTGFSATTSSTTNFSTANAQITGGAISATPISGSTGSFTTQVATNFSTANAQITGGNVNNLTGFSATTSSTTNFSTANAQITGGAISATPISGSTGVFTIANIALLGATTVQAASIGNVGAVITGTLLTSAQTNITGLGTVLYGTWNANLITTSYGGTGLSSFTSGGAVYASSSSALTTGTLPVTAGGSGVATLTGIVYGNGTSAFTAATGAQLSAVLGNTAITNANNAVVAANASAVSTSNFRMYQSGSKLYFSYNGTPIASLDSSGHFTAANDISAFTSP